VKSKRKFTLRWALLTALLVPVIVLGFVLMVRLEGHAPQVTHNMTTPFVGAPREILLDIADRGSGLQSIQVFVSQDGRETLLKDVQFQGSMLWSGSGVASHQLSLTLDPRALSLKEGEAQMRIEVRDFSWRNWWHGNLTVDDLPLVVDTRAPQIEVLSRLHYINQGGSGVVVYRLSETCPTHGILVGDHFYPGSPAGGKDPKRMIAFFAVSYDQGTDTAVRATATDLAGNQTQMGFHCRIRGKSFRQDVINISANFIRDKMLPLLVAEGGGDATETDLEKIFLAVNRTMRQDNYETLTQLGRQSAPEKLWEGGFLRLPKAANRAQFADHRVYRFDGAEIDRQVHLGADLASLEQSPVPAANNGRVVFADRVGIYGNTVVIDHGFGLFSLYSHLSAIGVEPGSQVKKGDIIGHTGATGLAGGDHLHFGMMIHDTFVNPVEWWDSHWINDNVLTKLKLVEDAGGGQG
jgi:murein DD-endopeptidase MepM/ murein hydrolase activator NlpD